MLATFSTPALTLLFLGVATGLGAAFVWAIWEFEQVAKPHRRRGRAG